METTPVCPHCGSDKLEMEVTIQHLYDPHKAEFEDGEFVEVTDKQEVVQTPFDPEFACNECGQYFNQPEAQS